MIIEKRIGGPYGRDYIEQMAVREGRSPEDNAYGLIVGVQEDGRELPVICGHGGSMWLCPGCKDNALKVATDPENQG